MGNKTDTVLAVTSFVAAAVLGLMAVTAGYAASRSDEAVERPLLASLAAPQVAVASVASAPGR